MLIQTYLTQFFIFTFLNNLNSCDSCISINLSTVTSEKQNVIINVIVQNHTSKTISLYELIKRCDDISINFPWELIIKKEGKEYEYPLIVTGAGQLIKIRRNDTYQFNLCINFEKLVRSENVRSLTKTEDINRDYGSYDIILSYTNEEKTCIRSNQLKVPYERNF
jgi:hypothetical protein